MERKKPDHERQNNTDVLLQAFENTDISVFMYYPREKRIVVPKTVCEKYHCEEEYLNMPESLGEAFVLPEDYPAFYESYLKIDRGEKSATSKFHSKDLSLCWRVTLTVLNWKKDQPAEEVLGVIEDISEWDRDKQLIRQIQSRMKETEEDFELQEARRLISVAIGSQYYALYHIWLEKRSFICYQEKLSGILDVIGERGAYEPAWEHYISDYIEPDDQASMREFADINTLPYRLSDKNTISHVYRRKGIGWTRGQFIVAKRDSDGNAKNLIYTVIDINIEKNKEIAQKKALYEAQHDPLTGVYNRKGFDSMKSSSEIRNIPIGLMIIDIDNFKMINDHHGHEIGDQILREVSQILKGMFRNEDKVFRIGGDEFCILLKNCNESAWEKICEKLGKIHVALTEEFKEISITLSCGVCFSSEGYHDNLYKQADEALYVTKKGGRAGCTLSDGRTGHMVSWHDNNLSIKTQNVMALSDTGMYQFEWFSEKEKSPRLICGEVAKLIFEFPANASPEECFRLWYEGVDSLYIDTIKDAFTKAIQGNLMECTYRWNHPKYGSIFIRTGGKGMMEEDRQILYGYHHTMKDTEIIENDDEKKILDAICESYFCSYYIDLNRDSFTILKGAAGEQKLNMQLDHASATLNHAIEVLADSDDRDRMRSFADLKTLSQRLEKENHIDCEYMSLSEQKWCRASFFPVKRNEDGSVNKVLYVVTSLDDQKAREVRNSVLNKKSVESLYNNVPGGIVMYEWNGTELKTLHISAYYEREYGYTLNSEQGENRGPDFKRVHPEDLVGYQSAILEALNQTHELYYEYRVWNQSKKRYVWTRIDATSEVQSDGTSLVYALYTDVTKQKDMELNLKKSHDSMATALEASNLLSYEYDPVLHTGVCFTDENYFGLPKIIENYPDSLKDMDLFYQEDVDRFIETAHKMDYGTERAQCDVRIKKNEEYCWYTCIFDSYFAPDKLRQVSILTVIDISERKALINRLRHESEHDPLTDLYNRNTVFRKGEELIKTYPEEQFVIIHIDMKHFRLYNTFFGDQEGDRLLCDVADMFRWMDADYNHWVYGRIEADVFCAVFPYDLEKYQTHLTKVFDILHSYRTDFLIEPVIGVYFISDPNMSMEAMFTRATLAAKAVLPGTPYATVIYNELLEQKLSEDQQIINEMQNAVDNEQFEVYLQPKYSLKTNKSVGAEALVRWVHPEKGIISPAKFIPLFESNGFIITLDRYMWEHVCQNLNRWKKEGKTITPVSVNVSRLSMFSQSTVEYLKNLIKKYDIAPQYLQLELTESAYIDDPEEMKLQMHALREAGFRILLDDFGSGYSCLNTLRELPVDVLKLDMRFLDFNQQNQKGRLIISSIIRMSNLLNLEVIAEGVEQQEQADFLKEMGCEYVQGYLMARPMPVKDYEKIIREII